MEDAYENVESDAAAEGTLAHELGEYLIKFNLGRLEKYYTKARLKELKSHKLYTPAMFAYMESYASFVIEMYHEVLAKDPTAIIKLEARVSFSKYAPEGSGTVDVQIIGRNVLIIIDLKYGKGVPVFAENNSQLRLYALGALEEAPHPVELISMFIYQPRLESITNDVLTADELTKWGRVVVKPAALKAFNGIGQHNAGPWCKFCRAKVLCRANYERQTLILKYMEKQKEELTPNEVSAIVLQSADCIKWLKDVTEFALHKAQRGQQWPGLKVVRSISRRIITDAEKAAQILLTEAMLKPSEIYKPRELINLTDIEALVGKTEFPGLMGEVVVKPEGSPTLVPESDKRDALDKSKEARDVFKEYIIE
jgi:hypothetical protein